MTDKVCKFVLEQFSKECNKYPNQEQNYCFLLNIMLSKCLEK
jgi:hypothetical protein